MGIVDGPYVSIMKNCEGKEGSFEWFHEHKHVMDVSLLLKFEYARPFVLLWLLISTLLTMGHPQESIYWTLLLFAVLLEWLLFWVPEMRADLYAFHKTGDWKMFLFRLKRPPN